MTRPRSKWISTAVFFAALTLACIGAAWASTNHQSGLRSEFQERLRRWEIDSDFEVISAERVGWLDWSQNARVKLKTGRTWDEVGVKLKRKNPGIFKMHTDSEIVVQQGDLGVFLTRKDNEILASATH